MPINTDHRNLREAKLTLVLEVVTGLPNHGHAAPTNRALLDRKGVEVATTVRGDVLIWSGNGTSHVSWVDTMTGTTAIQKGGTFAPKKYDNLSQHSDNIRARRQGAPYRRL